MHEYISQVTIYIYIYLSDVCSRKYILYAIRVLHVLHWKNLHCVFERRTSLGIMEGKLAVHLESLNAVVLWFPEVPKIGPLWWWETPYSRTAVRLVAVVSPVLNICRSTSVWRKQVICVTRVVLLLKLLSLHTELLGHFILFYCHFSVYIHIYIYVYIAIEITNNIYIYI